MYPIVCVEHSDPSVVCSWTVFTEPGPDQWPAGPAGGGHEGETGRPGEGEFTLASIIWKCLFAKLLLLASESDISSCFVSFLLKVS